MATEGKGPAASIESEDELPEVDDTIVANLSDQVWGILLDNFD